MSLKDLIEESITTNLTEALAMPKLSKNQYANQYHKLKTSRNVNDWDTADRLADEAEKTHGKDFRNDMENHQHNVQVGGQGVYHDATHAAWRRQNDILIPALEKLHGATTAPPKEKSIVSKAVTSVGDHFAKSNTQLGAIVRGFRAVKKAVSK